MGYDVKFVAKDLDPEVLQDPGVVEELSQLLDTTAISVAEYVERFTGGKEVEIIIHLVPDPRKPTKLKLLK